jgi:hypothetical protein
LPDVRCPLSSLPGMFAVQWCVGLGIDRPRANGLGTLVACRGVAVFAASRVLSYL